MVKRSFPPPTSDTLVFTGSDLITVNSGRSDSHQFFVELDLRWTLYTSWRASPARTSATGAGHGQAPSSCRRPKSLTSRRSAAGAMSYIWQRREAREHCRSKQSASGTEAGARLLHL